MEKIADLSYSVNFRLTVSTLLNLSDDMLINDVNGRPHPLSQDHVQMILVIGWVSFLLSWMFNIMYYRVHPSAVDFNLKSFKAKLFIWILGKRVKLPGYQVEYNDDRHKHGLTVRELSHQIKSSINPI